MIINKIIRDYRGKNNPNFKHGICYFGKFCIKCNKKISYGAIMCRSCSKIKHGETIKNHYCIDCNIVITRYDAKRCHSCSRKGKLNHMFGKNVSKNTRLKISLANTKNIEKKKCINCGAIIHRQAIRCSKCYHEMNSKRLFGKNNPNYIDGRSFIDYPPEFNDTLKYKIRERDNFECQNCGMIEEEHIIVYGQVLHIHHIDYNKFNSLEINLTSLCISCNARANKNREFWKEYYTEKNKILVRP